jgi:hypothetical protein
LVYVARVWFANTALENPAVTALTFVDGQKFNTGTMPGAQTLLEPSWFQLRC